MSKELILLLPRAVPGAGKSTFISAIVGSNPDSIICSADHFFMKDGEYKFNPAQLGIAHKLCKEKCEKAMQDKIGIIAVDNTNINEKDLNIYIDLAKEYGYKVISFVVENRHGNTSIHGVPEEKRAQMAETLLKSIKLV